MIKVDYIIIGSVPPPRGGVAVYLERKVFLLRSQGKLVVLQNPRKIFSLIALLTQLSVFKTGSRVELHTANPIALALVCLFRVESLITFYDHNYSQSFQKRKFPFEFLLKYFVARVGRLIIVGEHLRRNYENIYLRSLADLTVEIPYIALSDVALDRTAIPDSARIFIAHHKIFFINAAWKLSDDEFGRDLYGIQWSIEAFLNVYNAGSEVGLVVIIGSECKEKFEKIREICSDKLNILILQGDYDLCDFLAERGSILLRTTTTDGDSLSVREALELGVPVIASDVVPRPAGARLYKLHDRPSFEKAMKFEVNNFVRKN